MNIDKQLEEILIGLDGDINEEAISQIKQSILKAIMEKAPKKSKGAFHWMDWETDPVTEGVCKYKDAPMMADGSSCDFVINKTIKEFESVIKEVLK